MVGPLHKIYHESRGTYRQRMVRVAGARRDVGCHFTSYRQLLSGGLSEQRDDHILQRDHADAQLNQFGVRQHGYFRQRSEKILAIMWAIHSPAALVVPS